MKRLFGCALLFCSAGIRAVSEPVVKKVLDNGLVVLVRPVATTQKVSVQLWYGVGSKDEIAGERGLAHLLEHMVFKGTHKLSEADIPAITHLLSGSCNAHTSVDYTNYHFDVPLQHWHEVLPILADCMSNCTFKQDLLNAEFKVVIQELKMNRDNPIRGLMEKMFNTLFSDHPYHHPTIGYKQDLWTVTSKNLHAFYKKHYVPNNAVLVVVGNVDAQDVIAKVQQHFGSIKPDTTYRKEKFSHDNNIPAQDVTIYRDVQNSELVLAYVIPGIQGRKDYALDVLIYALCSGKSSRITSKIVEERRLANWIQAFTIDFFEHDVLFFRFEPQRVEDAPEIIEIIQEELAEIVRNGLTESELHSSAVKITNEFYSLMESNYAQGRFIGKYFLANGNEQYINNYATETSEVNKEIKSFLSQYCSPSQRHKGAILPFSENDRVQWRQTQERSDKEDAAFLSERVRISDVEPGNYVHTVTPKNAELTKVKKPSTFVLSNGLSIATQQNAIVPKIEIALKLKASHFNDPENFQGMYSLLCSMMYEGTKNYPGISFAQEFDDHAISLAIEPGLIKMSVLASEFEKGIELLGEIVTNVSFDAKALTKVKQIAFSRYQHFLDSPGEIAHQLAQKAVYGNHPYGRRTIPDGQVIKSVTREHLIDWYHTVISPKGAYMALVGDLKGYDVQALLEKYLNGWQGEEPEDPVYPELSPTDAETVDYHMERDQVVLKYVGLSVPRMHPDFDALLVFDQILSGGLNSRLFNLRMKYSIFYKSRGSLTAGAGHQPGMVSLETLVSKDRSVEAEQLLDMLINNVVDTVTAQEVEEAKRIILNAVTDWYSTSNSIATTLLFLKQYQLPYDYFEHLSTRLEQLSLEKVKEAVKKVLRRDRMALIKVGRAH